MNRSQGMGVAGRLDIQRFLQRHVTIPILPLWWMANLWTSLRPGIVGMVHAVGDRVREKC